MRFQDKIAIVTGGGSGMGKEVATRFVAEGGSVVINGRNGPKAEAAAHEIDPTGTRVAVHVGDISVPATGEALLKAALDRFGRLDVLFNNAGIFAPKPFLEVTEVEFDRFLDNILNSAFFTAQATTRAMKAAGRGPRRRDRTDRLHVGPASDRRHAVLSLFSGEGRRTRPGQESRHRAGAGQDPRECDRTSGDRDARLRHLSNA